MREINASEIADAVSRLAIEANQSLGEDVILALQRGRKEETSATGREIIAQLLENADLARREQIPMCQDTGMTVVFLEIGQEVHVNGGIVEAVQQGVRHGYREGFFRASVVDPPVGARVNTGDNTPAVIHAAIVAGDRIRITVAPKGGGSENMSAVRMLKPAQGWEGVKNFILETVERAGPNPCPPVIIGVGIGGNFELCALLAKKALLRPVGQPHPNPEFASLETELLTAIRRLGIGPAGLGGTITALGVSIETHPCHIASLPVAVNVNCHAHRHREAVL